MVNLKNLHDLYTSSPDAISGLAEQQGLDPVVAMGVVKLLIANDGNLASLSPRQREHFDRSIQPLIGG